MNDSRTRCGPGGKTALVSLCLLFGGVGTSAAAPATAPAAPDVVRVQGTRFVSAGRPFYFVGANLNVMHGPRSRGRAAATIAAAARDGLRVGRVWALGEGLADDPAWKARDYLFRVGPRGWQSAAYKQLDRVLDLARRHGLRLVITLSNRWGDYGGIPMYLRWAGHRDTESYGYSDRFFTDKRVRGWFFEHVRRIVTRINSVNGVAYRDDPTIFAWELQNEMAGTPEAAAARRRWFSSMAAKLRRIDSKHMIVPGVIGYKLQLERANWIKMCRLPAVAYCDQHVYPEEHLRSRGRRVLSFIDDRVQLAHHVVGKPIVFGEFGFADRGSARRRARLHGRFLSRLFHDGGNGALVWIYQPKLAWKRRYGVLIDRRRYRAVRRVLARHARRVAARPPTARNRRINAARGTVPLAATHAMLRRWRGVHRRWRRLAGGRRLELAVDRFHRAWFEEAGSWDGGILVHTYGRRTGWVEYRFAGPPFLPRRMRIAARVSSEYPGSSAPRHGFSLVEVSVDGVQVGLHRAMPDDGVGSWTAFEIDEPRLLRKLRRGVHRLRFRVRAGPLGNGLALYGRETRLNREPVTRPGPIAITALR